MNLEAADQLLALGLVDPAATRYYYALYQAAVHRLTLLGWTPRRIRSGAVDWDHSMVKNSVTLVRGRRQDRLLYQAVRDLRVQADYKAQSVTVALLQARVGAVRQFVEEAIR